MSLLTNMNLEGLFSALPAAGNAGRLYFATDTNNIYKDNGTAWVLVTSAGSVYAADTGTANAYTVALLTAPASYAAGLEVVFKVANANTGAATLNVNSLGAKSIVKAGTAALAAGDLVAGQIVTVVYDGTSFQLQGAPGAGGGGGSVNVNGSAVSSPNFNGTTPAAPSGNTNVMFQVSGSSVSAYVPNSGGGGGFSGDILSPDKPTGTLGYQKNEYATVAAGATINLLNYTGGDGYVDWIALAIAGTIGNPGPNMTVNIYYNGEGTPTVSVPLYSLFMSVYCNGLEPSFFANRYLGFNSPSAGDQSYYCRIPIPFPGSIKIDLVNNEGTPFTVWSACEYQAGVPNTTWTNTRKLRVSAFFNNACAPNSVNTFVNYAGSAGRFLGMWFLDDEFPNSFSPHGASLEGNFRLYLDSFSKVWAASTAFTSGQTIIDSNGNLQTVTTAGTTGSSQPTWGITSGATVTDGSVVWTCTVGDPANVWKASTAYVVGMGIIDPNGNVQTVTSAGTTGSSQPTWATSGTTADGSVTWTCSAGSGRLKCSAQSSGTEDWFGMGFYFGAHGVTGNNNLNGGGGNTSQIAQGWTGNGDIGTTIITGGQPNTTQGAYRFHTLDKRNFSSAFKLTWNCGDSAEVASESGTATVWATVFYYTAS